MITLHDVSLSFGEITVLDGFNGEFEENKITCILGPSGCGKTTLLNLLSSSLKQDSGMMTLPKRVSYVFQEELLIPQKTAYQNLELILKSVYSDKTELNTVINKFLGLAELEQAGDLYPLQMSGGMRQRLALIRAFAYPSELLLMDEPFKELDITLRDTIIKAFLNLYEENRRTVLFVTHDMDEALMTGDYIYVYGNKPLRLQTKFTVEGNKSTRKIYDENLTMIKTEIYREAEKWQLKK